MCKTCEWCGKPIDQPTTGRPRKYCSNKCKQEAYREKQRKKCLNLFHEEDYRIVRPKYLLEDSVLRFTDNDSLFYQNDYNWGLGESNLNEYSAEDKKSESFYVKKELERIYKRKPNK